MATLNTAAIYQPRGRDRMIMVVAAILFGTESVLIQLGYQGGFTILTLGAARFVVATLIFLAAALLLKRPLIVRRGLRLRMLTLGLLATAGTGLFYVALSLMPAPLAVLFFYAYPSLTALMSRFFFHGPPLGRVTIAALLISGIGLVLLYWSSVAGLSLLGTACVLLAAVFQAARLNLADSVMQHADMVTFNLNSTVITMVCYNVTVLAGAGGGFQAAAAADSGGWAAMLALALVISVAAVFLMFRSIHILGAVECSLTMLLEPLVTAVLALLIFGDSLSGLQLCGGALILVAVALPPLTLLYNKKNDPAKLNP